MINSEKQPEISKDTIKMWKAIFDPQNAHLFTKEAALEAFKHIDVSKQFKVNEGESNA